MLCTWGSNHDGQAGESASDAPEKNAPRCVSAVFHAVIGPCVSIRQVAAGLAHTLFLTEFGDVFSCGRNKEGQLGHGTTNCSCGRQGQLQLIPGLRPWRIMKVAAGDRHSVALTEAGVAFEWGLLLPVENSESNGTSRWAERRQGLGVEMDDATEEFKRRIVAASYLEYMRNGLAEGSSDDMDEDTLAKIIDGGERFRVAVREPRACIGLEGQVIHNVACGYAHTIVANFEGSLLASGYNEKGQLGNGSRFHSMGFNPVCTPAPLCSCGVSPVDQAKLGGLSLCTLACGHNHTAALLSGGQVVTWGFGTFGQLGLGKERKESFFPQVVEVEGPAVEVACGDNHSLILLESGKIVAFGHRDALGTGSNFTRLPQEVSDFGEKRIHRIFAGGMASFALADGMAASNLDLYSWGYNQRQHLGRGLWIQQLSPQPVKFPQDLFSGKDLSDFGVGTGHCMAAMHLPKDKVVLPTEASEPHTRNARLLAMLRDTDSHDVVLRAAHEEAQGAHRLVLRLRCPQLLSKICRAEGGVSEIMLLEYSSECVAALLEYLYCDFCRSSHKVAAELLPLAVSLGLARLAAALGEASHSGGCRDDGESRYVRTAAGRWVKVETSETEGRAASNVYPSTYARDLERLVVAVCSSSDEGNQDGSDDSNTDVVTLKVQEYQSGADKTLTEEQRFRVSRALLQTVDVFKALLNFPSAAEGPVNTVTDDVVAFSCLLRFMATGDRDVIPADPRVALAVLIEAHRRGLADVMGVAEHRLLESLQGPEAHSLDVHDMVPVAKLYSLDRCVAALGALRA